MKRASDKAAPYFEKAHELLKAEPLPRDIMDQLDKLLKKVPRLLRDEFGDLYESAAIREPYPGYYDGAPAGGESEADRV